MDHVLSPPEILAPAGDMEALHAAVAAGADAVYFGLQNFNARARATNFSVETLAETLRTLHASGVRGYVTLNTLIFDSELDGITAAIRACAEAGVDALIVQDLGVLSLARRVAPGLPVHASTQMTCTDASSVLLASELGASRVILAREMSLEEIRTIRQATNVELEVFVHGALCIAYSGQCLTSEAIGGRSANRGACAQACRLPYDLIVDGEKRDLGDRAFLLSPEDLETSSLVPELIAAGVRSLKIEGRLKGSSYVALTTRLYRQAVDAAFDPTKGMSHGALSSTAGLREASLQTFSRGSGPGFLNGVNHQRLVEGETSDHRGVQVGTSLGVRVRGGRRLVGLALSMPLIRGDGLLVQGGYGGLGELGGRVWGIWRDGIEVDAAGGAPDEVVNVEVWFGPEKVVSQVGEGRRVFRTNSNDAQKAAHGVRTAPTKRALHVRVSGNVGERPLFEAWIAGREGERVSVLGEFTVERALSQPLSATIVRDKLGQLGETPFQLGELSIELPEGSMIPLSSLKKARRALVEALDGILHVPHVATDITASDLIARTRETVSATNAAEAGAGLFVLCRTLGQAEAALEAGADGVYLDFLDLQGTGVAFRALRDRVGNRAKLGVAPPRIRKPGEEKIDHYLASLSPDMVLVRSLGSLRDGGAASAHRIGDFSLNVTNGLSAREVMRRGLSAFTPSFDLDAAQLMSLLTPELAGLAEVVVHHPMPLFHMEHCVFAALLSEGRDYRTCGRPCDRHKLSLRDRAGMDHPIEADVSCRNTVFHAAAQSAATMVASLQKAGVRRYRIELVRETPEETARVVGNYRRLFSGEETAEFVWHALRATEGYGVVRGSLRIIH